MAATPEAVNRVRNLLPNAKVHAKIESQPGVDNIQAIADAADGLIVARADLAIEVPLEQLGVATEAAAAAAGNLDREIIVASGLFESLERSEHPSIAETMDLWYQHRVLGVRQFLISGSASVSKPLEAASWARALLRAFDDAAVRDVAAE